MHFMLISVFILGYLAIAFEQRIKVNKAAVSILLAVFCWGIILINHRHHDALILEQLLCHLADISQILFFLIGVMTIVEIIDSYHGFRAIAHLIKAKNKIALLWVISFIAFFLSSFLDNVTASIIMITLLRQVIPERKARLLFVGMIIISANAGGAWTPIGDVTTTMLWIKGFISSGKIMQTLFVPSMLSALIPLIYFSFLIKGNALDELSRDKQEAISGSRQVFGMGVGALLLVPA